MGVSHVVPGEEPRGEPCWMVQGTEKGLLVCNEAVRFEGQEVVWSWVPWVSRATVSLLMLDQVGEEVLQGDAIWPDFCF